MSRRRLERGFWNGRQVSISDKEHELLFAFRTERGKWFFRFDMTIQLDWPYPNEFETEFRLPRKTKKALWKHLNGHPDYVMTTGVTEYSTWPGSDYGHWARLVSTPGLIRKGRKP